MPNLNCSSPFDRSRFLSAATILLCAGLAMPASAQDAKPEAPKAADPVKDAPKEPAKDAPKDATKDDKKPPAPRGMFNRRVSDGEPTILAFKAAKVETLIPFIVESTGKVVLPQPDVLSRTITILNDEPIARARALDLVFLALQQAGVAVVETEDLITLRDINDLKKQDVPVLGHNVSTLTRGDLGTVATKVYALEHSAAENVAEIVKESIPDYASLQFDKASNQLVVMANMRQLQRIERLVLSLDRPAAASLQTETFRLRYADADSIAALVKELFSADARAGGGNNNANNPFANIFGGGRGGGGGGPGNTGGGGGNRGGGGGGSSASSSGTASDPSAVLSANLRVSANKQQNSVTVVAEAPVIEQVRKQINEFWDKPLSEEQVIPKIYDLVNTDVIKIRDILEAQFGKGTSSTAGGGGGGGGGNNGFGGNNNQATQASQGAGRLAGQFAFSALQDSNRLMVIAKSPDNIQMMDRIIAELDRPQTSGLPQIVELKHAAAEEVAEQVNTLLAQDGTLASIRRSESGLSSSASTASPFASNSSTTGADTSGTNNATGGTSADSIAFWWSRSRTPTDRRGASNLIGNIRIVPVWRQNALMVASPPEYRQAIADMIASLDRPGRQVLLSAIICEVTADDETAFGLRWSSQAITPTNGDNSFSLGTSTNNTKANFLPGLFDTSTLTANANLNVLLQALNEKTKVNILSEPRIFTSDNQEATFFDGKDIPFINDQTTNQVGQTTASFDYKAVGIQLKARPRITVTGDIDLQVNIQLASITPGETIQGAQVVDRRETTTHLILRGGQTIVISGILRKEDSDIVRKVPLLGDIPLLGELFKSREKSKVQKELLVFVTPIVVENTAALDEVNKPYRERLNQLRGELNGEEPKPAADKSKDIEG